MKTNLNDIIPTDFDSELIKQLELINNFDLEIPDSYFSLIEQKLPVVRSMVVGGDLLCKNLLCKKESNENIALWFVSVLKCMNNFLLINNIDANCNCVIIGDNMLNYAYSLPIKVILDNAENIFSIPQDTYVLILSHDVCLQYTYEDELYVYSF